MFTFFQIFNALQYVIIIVLGSKIRIPVILMTVGACRIYVKIFDQVHNLVIRNIIRYLKVGNRRLDHYKT